MSKYNWKFYTIGGVTRVKIESGEDIAHLGELDQKLWTALSCPVKGLEMDETTLAMIDTDNDGKIHVNEVVAAAGWLSSVLKDPGAVLKGDDEIPFSEINEENEEGKALICSARQILANLGLEKESISVADTSDSVAIFAKTKFNGDGIITPASTDDEALQGVIKAAIETVGSSVDRSGEAGVNADQVEAFYAACKDYSEWKAACTADALPYGDNTEAALAACTALKDKISDYFMRCKLSAFDADATSALDVSVAKIEAISGSDLSACDEISTYPLARINGASELPLTGINPAWQGAFDALKSLVLDVDFAGKESISEAEWNATLAKFGAYEAWKGAKKGDAVEALGIEAVDAILKADRKQALLDLIAEDKALEAEAGAIDAVNKLTHLYRDFGKLLRNFVTFTDFYASYKGETKAVFQAGTLYINQRSCDLCIKVADMGKHGDMAGLSGMYIVYCACTSKSLGTSMDIAAVVTDGDVDGLRVGMNALFYDNQGNDYDAVITKIIENPISIRQAFWAPYKKVARTITDRINKSAAEKSSKVDSNLTAKASTAQIPESKDEAAKAVTPAPAQSFDIAKFAGIFAAIGMGVGFIGSALLKIIDPWTNIIVILILLVLGISGPSMFIAWQKLRKRNLAPVLNANGWAINSNILVNTKFGATLTSLAKMPKAVAGGDPFSMKTPLWKKILRWLIALVIVAGAVLYFTDNLGFMGIHRHKAEPAQTECCAEAAAEAPAEAAAETAE